MEPMVSIVVPVYNAQDYIVECLDSIANQSMKDFEVLLIDDGSTDRSGEICDDYAKKDSRFRVFHKSNQGVSAARNTGIRHSGGKYIAFVDADDYLAPDAYERMTRNAEETKASQAVCSFYYVCDGVLTEKRTYFENTILEKDQVEEINRAMAFSGGSDERTALLSSPCNKLYLRKIIAEHEILFEEGINYGEDLLFNIYFYRFAEKVSFLDSSLYYRRIINDSLSNTYREKRFQEASTAFKCYRDWFPEDFDADTYHTSVLNLNRNCIRYSARNRGAGGLKAYLRSVKHNAVLEESYRYRYGSSLKRILAEKGEIIFAAIPLLKYYIKKVI